VIAEGEEAWTQLATRIPDATTNPSLLFQAAQMPEYFKQAIHDLKSLRRRQRFGEVEGGEPAQVTASAPAA
jgi:transaldolase